LEGNKVIQREILTCFEFNSSDENLDMYRNAINVYYKNSRECDKEIMNSVVYLRENRLLYYDTPKITIGDKYPDVKLFDLKGNITMLSSIIESKVHSKTLLAAFSTS